MDVYAAAYRGATGVDLTAGSLNIVLDQPWIMTNPALQVNAVEVGVDLGLVPCVVSGIPCWILRTDNNNAGTGHHDLAVLEIVSAVHLRSALALSDGDEVSVEIEE